MFLFLLAPRAWSLTPVLYNASDFTGTQNNRVATLTPAGLQAATNAFLIPITVKLTPVAGLATNAVIPGHYTLAIDGIQQTIGLDIPDTNVTQNLWQCVSTNNLSALQYFGWVSYLSSHYLQQSNLIGRTNLTVTWSNGIAYLDVTPTANPDTTIHNVADYGAALNGVTDDTAAWQAALNAGDVFQPSNTVSAISAQLYVPSNRRVIGISMPKLFRIAGTGAPTTNALTNCDFFVNAGMSNGTTDSNIYISGFVLDGNYPNQTPLTPTDSNPYMGQTAMRFLRVNHLTVENCVVTNCPGFGIQNAAIVDGRFNNLGFWYAGTFPSQDAIHNNGPLNHLRFNHILVVSNNTVALAVNANDDSYGLLSTGDISDVVIEDIVRAGVPGSDHGGAHLQILNSTNNISDVHASGLYGTNGLNGMLVMSANEGSNPFNIMRGITVDHFSVTSLYSNAPLLGLALGVDSLKVQNGVWYCGSGSNNALGSAAGFGQNLLNYQAAGSISNLLLANIEVFNHSATNESVGSLESDSPIVLRQPSTGTIKNLTLQNIVIHRTALTAGFPFLDDGANAGGFLGSLNVGSLTLDNFDTFGSFNSPLPTFGIMSGIRMIGGDWTAGLALTQKAGYGSLLVRSNLLAKDVQVTDVGASHVVVSDAGTNLTNSLTTPAELATLHLGSNVVAGIGMTASTNGAIVTLSTNGGVSAAVSNTFAPLNSPGFTGTVSGIPSYLSTSLNNATIAGGVNYAFGNGGVALPTTFLTELSARSLIDGVTEIDGFRVRLYRPSSAVNSGTNVQFFAVTNGVVSTNMQCNITGDSSTLDIVVTNTGVPIIFAAPFTNTLSWGISNNQGTSIGSEMTSIRARVKITSQ